MAGGVNRAWIVGKGSGERGVTHMLNLMAATARRAAKDPQIRGVAESIINGEQTYTGRARAIFDWIVQNIKYVPDPIYIDAIRSPRELILFPSGDCDDLATLAAALLGSIGIQSRVVAVGFGNENAPFSHVFTQALIGNEWRTLDATPELNDDGSICRHYGYDEEPYGIENRKVRNV